MGWAGMGAGCTFANSIVQDHIRCVRESVISGQKICGRTQKMIDDRRLFESENERSRVGVWEIGKGVEIACKTGHWLAPGKSTTRLKIKAKYSHLRTYA